MTYVWKRKILNPLTMMKFLLLEKQVQRGRGGQILSAGRKIFNSLVLTGSRFQDKKK